MDFTLAKEQEAIRSTVREFAEREIAPIAAKIDQEDKIPDRVLQEAAKLNLFGIPVDRKYGGAGWGYVELTLALEEIARESSSVAFLLMAHYLPIVALKLFGTEEQKTKFLPPLCQGSGIGSFAFTEPATGSDPKMITTTAILKDNEYILNGTKRFITNSPYNGVVIMFALDNGGVSAFIIEKNQPGYTTGKPADKMGIRGVPVTDVYLKDVRVPQSDLIGKKGEGYRVLLPTIAYGKMDVAATLLGVSQASLEEAIKYAKERMVRDKPIASFQAIQWLIADIAALVEAERWLTYRLAFLADNGADIAKESALTKLFVSEAATQVASKALEVHGSYGYTKEMKIERLYRDAKVGEIVEGVNEIQRVIIASSLLR